MRDLDQQQTIHCHGVSQLSLERPRWWYLSLGGLLLAMGACSDDSASPQADLSRDHAFPHETAPLSEAGREAQVKPDAAPDAPADLALDLAGPDAPVDLAVDLATTDTPAMDGQPLDLLARDLLAGEAIDAAGPLPAHRFCHSPQTLVLQDGTQSVSGDTTLAGDEFNSITCQNNLSEKMAGPQLYFQVTLQQGKKYRVMLSSTFDGALYAVPAATACNAAALDQACFTVLPSSDYQLSADEIKAAGTEVIALKPSVEGDWLLVVDSYSLLESGVFTLTISEVVTPINGTCQTAQALSLAGGSITVQGSTAGTLNEFASSITCGGLLPFAGGQVYYTVNIPAAKGVGLTLSPSFDGSLYLFPASASCAPAAISQNCGSGGASGAKLEVVAGGASEILHFAPETPGDYVVVVDSLVPVAAGPFTLIIAEYDPPAHRACLAAQSLTLATSPLSQSATTLGATNQFGQVITCGSKYHFVGPQLYYRLSLEGDKTYTLELSPSGWDAALYLFSDVTCTAGTINSQCSTAGFAADLNGVDGKETLIIKPTVAGDYLLVVDSYALDEAGPFTLVVSWQ
jgi:hypothetical protein